MQNDQESKLSEEIARLNARISELEQLMRTHLAAQQGPEPQKLPPAPTQPPTPAPPPTQPPVPQRAVPPITAPRSSATFEAEIGGNWLNKIGAVALVLGMAFFLTYAIENRWIDETGRIIIGLIVGMACLYGGEYYQKKNFPRYAQGVSGAGIAILYFTIYAAFAFYHLVPRLPAFAFMFVITVAAAAVAVRHNAPSIAALGIIGGFFTPVLIRETAGLPSDTQVQLFAYMAILDLGVLGVTFYKGWRGLNLLSLAGTTLVAAGWFIESYSPNMLGRTMLLLTIFFAIFAAQSFVQNVVARRALNAADFVMAVAAPALYFGVSCALLAPEYRIFLGGFAVVMAVAYLYFARSVRVTAFEDMRLRLLFLAVAVGFLTIAIPIQLHLRWVTVGWGAEAAVFAWIGFYLNSRAVRYFSLCLLGLVAIRSLFVDYFAWPALTPFINERFLAALFTIAMTTIVAWLYLRRRELVTGGEKAVATVLIIGANFLLICALSVETVGWTSRVYAATYAVDSFALSALWTVYAVLMLAAGIIWRHRPSRLMAVAVFGVVIAKSFLLDVWTLEMLHRIIAFVGLGAALLLVSYAYHAYRDRIERIVGIGHERETNE